MSSRKIAADECPYTDEQMSAVLTEVSLAVCKAYKGIPEDRLGRVMGLFTAMNGLAIPIGTALGGAIAEATGTPLLFTIDGAFILALGIGMALSKSVRQLD